ncbi:UDP-N-acetylmuramate--L-alanine ligase MurC [Symmachiella dynata]|nr:UDP-N-acetylmuramate--L-alanine ligase MurC [Symmachiella dynata]
MISPSAIHRLLQQGQLSQKGGEAKIASDPQTPSAHLIGICGSGMQALAELLSGLGYRVTGSDLQPLSDNLALLQARGLRVHQGHNRDFVPGEVDMVVYSPAVQADNPERALARELGIPQFSYSEMLGRLMADQVGVSIAGTHGKSTTTAMTASILDLAGRDPSAILGAEVLSRQSGGWSGSGNLFVVESCEYKQSFLDLSPKHAAILGIEPDHFDCYPDVEQAVDAFRQFAQKLPADGSLIVRGDCRNTMAACQDVAANVETFSLVPGMDWWAADIRRSWSGTRFRVFYKGDFFAEILLQVPGEHNVLNALAATALCAGLGLTAAEIREGLGEFRGIARRFEEIGSWRGVTLVDDYAHHPTAVAATLQAAREEFGDRRIWCAFQPHQISRTQILMQEFSESFSKADRVLITPIYAAREGTATESTDVARELSDRIARQHSQTRFCGSLDQTIATIEDEAQPGDVLITMGAGDINQVHHAFTRRLQRNHTPRRAAGAPHVFETGGTGSVLRDTEDPRRIATGHTGLSRERDAVPHPGRRLQSAHR